MALTDGLKLPIPDLTQSADGPAAVNDLANAMEDWAYDRILPSGVTRAPTLYWGSVTVLPSGTSVKRGDTAYYSTYSVMVMYDGANWRQCEIPTVSPGSGDTVVGFYHGQVRDHSVLGFQRWDANNTVWGSVDLGKPLAMLNGVNASGGIASGAWTNVPLPTVRKSIGVDTTTTSNRVTIQKAGWYNVHGIVSFAIATGSGAGRRIAGYYVNGVIAPFGQGTVYATVSNGSNVVGPVTPMLLSAGDYVQLFAYQDSGAAGVIDCTGSFLSVTYFGAP